MINDNQELNYETILLNHLDRISTLSTTLKDGEENYLYGSAQKIVLFQAIWSLKAFIPDSLKDEKYEEDFKRVNKEWAEIKGKFKENPNYEIDFRFNQLSCIINLLNRKGLILSANRSGVKKAGAFADG